MRMREREAHGETPDGVEANTADGKEADTDRWKRTPPDAVEADIAAAEEEAEPESIDVYVDAHGGACFTRVSLQVMQLRYAVSNPPHRELPPR